MMFKFGSWVFYLGSDGFYIERLNALHFFFGFVDYKQY